MRPEQLREQASILRESAVSLVGLSRQMEVQLNILEEAWRGKDADSGIQRGRILKKELQTCAESFLEISNSMRQIARQSEDAEKAAGRIAGDG